ncbi:exosome complex component RRP46-like [Ruditapes philippinarum]|uniref:exosome complex component RRP46-like n=1 Tax=Ruditapes philippinarum TaxID=129788 RepID=UPI00295AB20D|nr:exosome complex component RRP46-like [Ruditapes philippinarum]
MKSIKKEEIVSLRHLTCEMGHLSRPDGSATVYQGDTCVMVSVYGPGEVRMNKEQLDRATVDVVYKPKSGLPACVDKAFEKVVCNTCETVLLASLYPRSSINITVQEVQDSGSFLAACINSCCLALLDASVSMKCTMAAVSCCIDTDNEIILDPTKSQEEVAKSTFTFVFDSKDRNIISILAEGKYTQDQFQSCLVVCKEASESVFNFYRDSIKRKLSKTV